MAVSKARARKLALSLPGAYEVTHGGRPAFRTARRIFATLPDEPSLTLTFDRDTQDFFCAQSPGLLRPHPTGWGRLGYTQADLSAVDEATLLSALKAAHALAAPKPKAVKGKRPRKAKP